MKALSKTAAVIAAVLVLALLFLRYSERLDCTVSVSVSPASENEQRFDAFRESMTSGSFHGYVYETGVLGSASEYSFVTVNVHVKNPGLLPAEWVLLTPIQHSGDVACEISSAGPVDLKGGAEATEAITFLTTTPDAVTGCGIEYYVFGKMQSRVVLLNDQK